MRRRTKLSLGIAAALMLVAAIFTAVHKDTSKELSRETRDFSPTSVKRRALTTERTKTRPATRTLVASNLASPTTEEAVATGPSLLARAATRPHVGHRGSSGRRPTVGGGRARRFETRAEWQAAISRSLLLERNDLDSDLMRAPFVRLLAKTDLTRLTDESSAYIDENPESPLGYYFKAQAEWRTGDREAATATVEEAIANGAADDSWHALMKRDAAREPWEFVEDLSRSVAQDVTADARQAADE